MAEVLPPKRQAVVDRLRRRIENYRRHQSDCIPRYNQSFTGLVEQNIQDTLALKQRFLESKAKRAAKKTEKKLPENPLQNLHAVTFVPKRPGSDDHGPEPGGGYGEGPQAPKRPKSSEPLTKFSVEIVQQLEFTTTASNSQISTNVTVKALNTSVKSDMTTSSTVSPQPAPAQPSTPVECKQEQEDNPEFVDLEQCAAALEKDAQANGGSSFPGFSDLIGDETSDAIITSDAFKDLISEISDFHPAFLKDLDFDGETKHQPQQHQEHQHVFKTEEDSKGSSGQTQQQRVSVQQQQRMYSSSMDFSKAELSPAAQTLKQMAEQHQHKTQLGMGFTPATHKPYTEFQYNGSDFGSPQGNNNSQQFKPMVSQSPKSNFVSADNIKQEVFSTQNSPGVYSPSPGSQTPTGQPRLNTGFKQQYSPYGSPGPGHGSPQYTPRGPGPQPPPPQAPPPRPPSCPTSATLQINQAQQLHISQAQGQPPIQVSMAQNLHTEMKSSPATAVSVAANQGLYLNPSSDSFCSVSQSQSINFTQQSLRHRISVPQQHPQQQQHHQQHQHHQQQQEKMMQQQQEKMMQQQQEKMMMQEKMMQQQQEKMMQQQQQQEKMMQQEKLIQQQQEKIMQQQQEKMMQQQQEKMMMQQQQEKMIQQQEKLMQEKMMQEKMMHSQEKLMHPQMIRIPQHQMRPEFSKSQQLMGQHLPSMLQQPSFPQQSMPQQRLAQQPVPPSGPMMRPQGGYMMAGAVPGQAVSRIPYSRPQRPPSGAVMHPGGPEWRHMMLQQQQQQQRPSYHQAQGVMFSGGDLQLSAGQMQQVSHMAQHQSLAMHHQNSQMSVNLHMQQSMGHRQPPPPTSQMNSFPNYPPSYASNAPTQAPAQLPPTNDFNLDFLENQHFSDQDLLSSFNLQDIL